MSRKGQQRKCAQRDFANDQREEFKRLFDEIDINGNGYITRRELIHAFRIAGFNPKKKEIDNIMGVADKDNDRTIDLDEFLNVMEKTTMSRNPEEQREELRQAFKKFDLNGDGVIDKNEFKTIMRCGGETVDEVLEEAWKQADVNDDGVLQYEEFVALWTSV